MSGIVAKLHWPKRELRSVSKVLDQAHQTFQQLQEVELRLRSGRQKIRITPLRRRRSPPAQAASADASAPNP